MSLDPDRLCSDFESALGCPYASPGTTRWSGIASGVDCSGLFTAAAANQGVTLPHGSNAIARRHTDGPVPLSGLRLSRGMVVFKWKEQGAPASYQDGLGNYHHIGLVTCVSPLRIVHASSAAGRVVCDSSAAAWTHGASLRAMDRPASNDQQEENMTDMNDTNHTLLAVTASPALRVRSGPGAGCGKVGSLPQGTQVTADRLMDGWYHLADGSGWISAQYVKVLRQAAPEPDRLALLEQRVAALEALHREVEADGPDT